MYMSRHPVEANWFGFWNLPVAYHPQGPFFLSFSLFFLLEDYGIFVLYVKLTKCWQFICDQMKKYQSYILRSRELEDTYLCLDKLYIYMETTFAPVVPVAQQWHSSQWLLSYLNVIYSKSPELWPNYGNSISVLWCVILFVHLMLYS